MKEVQRDVQEVKVLSLYAVPKCDPNPTTEKVDIKCDLRMPLLRIYLKNTKLNLCISYNLGYGIIIVFMFMLLILYHLTPLPPLFL